MAVIADKYEASKKLSKVLVGVLDIAEKDAQKVVMAIDYLIEQHVLDSENKGNRAANWSRDY